MVRRQDDPWYQYNHDDWSEPLPIFDNPRKDQGCLRAIVALLTVTVVMIVVQLIRWKVSA